MCISLSQVWIYRSQLLHHFHVTDDNTMPSAKIKMPRTLIHIPVRCILKPKLTHFFHTVLPENTKSWQMTAWMRSIYIYIFNTVWGRHDVVNIFKLYGKSLKCFQKQTLCVFQVTKQQRGREMGKIIGESLSRPIPQIAFQWRIYKLSWTQTAKLQIRSGRVSQREDK